MAPSPLKLIKDSTAFHRAAFVQFLNDGIGNCALFGATNYIYNGRRKSFLTFVCV